MAASKLQNDYEKHFNKSIGSKGLIQSPEISPKNKDSTMHQSTGTLKGPNITSNSFVQHPSFDANACTSFAANEQQQRLASSRSKLKLKNMQAAGILGSAHVNKKLHKKQNSKFANPSNESSLDPVRPGQPRVQITTKPAGAVGKSVDTEVILSKLDRSGSRSPNRQANLLLKSALVQSVPQKHIDAFSSIPALPNLPIP